MDAKKIKDILTDNGFNCWISPKVEYHGTTQTMYSTVRMMPDEVTCHLIYILYELDCIAVINNVERVNGNIVTVSLYVEIYPRNMKSLDWEE